MDEQMSWEWFLHVIGVLVLFAVIACFIIEWIREERASKKRDALGQESANTRSNIPVICVSISGGCASIDRKPKGVIIIMLEQDRINHDSKGSNCIIYDVDETIEHGDNFLRIN